MPNGFFSRSRGTSAAVIAVALALAVMIVQNGIASVARYNDPAETLRWAPWDARALSGLSELTLTATASADERAAAAGLARAAIRRDPSLGTPFRVLGFVADADGDKAAARRLIEHAELMSRRDLPTQVWLIDAAVAREDMTGALRHFDIALRTSTLAPTVLFPVLNRALSEPEIVDALATTLAAKPNWRAQFLSDAIDKSPELAGLVRLESKLRTLGQPFDATHIKQLLVRLSDAGALDLVARLRPAVIAPSQLKALLLDPDFGADDGVFPFGWTLFNANGVGARRVSAASGRVGLEFTAETGRAGELLRQVIFLPPGRYQLRWKARHDATALAVSPVWSVICPGKPSRSLLSADLLPATTSGEGMFSVPADCPGQWLQLVARPGSAAQGVNGWIDRVDIAGIK